MSLLATTLATSIFLTCWTELNILVSISFHFLAGFEVRMSTMIAMTKACKLNHLLTGVKTEAKDTKFSSKAYGTRENKAINMEGRLQLDMLQVMQRDYKLRSYTLNSVCAQFLGKLSMYKDSGDSSVC